MNAATTLPSPITVEPAVFTPPHWLQTCLIEVADAKHKAAKEGSEHKVYEELGLICRAFEFAYSLHEGQYRASGEPYIAHPVAVAELLRDLGGSTVMIAAGFLHDVVEDTEVTVEDIEQQFGSEVRRLVEGVTKLSQYNFSSKKERQAENFRHMFLAMAEDIRVVVVKLADRLHNMRTLEHLTSEKQQRIAQETREIFVPLANRLGFGNIKWELEDLTFKYLEPNAYREMQALVADKRIDREMRLEAAVVSLRQQLEESGLSKFKISGRPKHLYSIYRKMQHQQKVFDEIYDLAGIRIILDTEDKNECYRALAIVHDAFRPIPGRFKDYIGLPKANRYQSLHTAVMGDWGRPLEVQIRTQSMHQVSEYGIAAHWKYKETGGSQATQITSDDEKFIWLRQLLEWQNDLKDAQEFLDTVKGNLFEDEVYVFTPKGDVVPLKRGATPVDFAYRIHTEVGNHCAGGKVNGRIVTLDTRLHNGDIVEILTQKNGHPSLDWLNFAVTESARNRIRQWYKRSHRDQNLSRGRDMLEKELGKSGFEALLKSDPMQTAAERCNYSTPEDLLAALGYGEVTLNLVVNRIREAVKAQQKVAPPAPETLDAQVAALSASLPKAQKEPPSSTTKSDKAPILGVEGLVHHLAGCCTPVPGEPIIGVVTMSSRGISIHRQGCQNLEQISGDRFVPLRWNTPNAPVQRPLTYPVNLQVEVIDRVGVLRDILTRLSDSNINVRDVRLTYPDQLVLIELCIEVRDRDQLDLTLTQVRKLSDVLNIRRVSRASD
jgi:GTP diphosphokinase / guanosine-3',5'-bis(diphosphate) 3'-diphosphatase